jgi:hypothetical protein
MVCCVISLLSLLILEDSHHRGTGSFTVHFGVHNLPLRTGIFSRNATSRARGLCDCRSRKWGQAAIVVRATSCQGAAIGRSAAQPTARRSAHLQTRRDPSA